MIGVEVPLIGDTDVLQGKMIGDYSVPYNNHQRGGRRRREAMKAVG